MLLTVDEIGPNGKFLCAIKQQAAIGVAFFPGVAGEGLPVNDIWCGPRGESLGAAAAMEVRLDGPSGTIAGCDHNSAFAQPCVQTGPWLNAHNCVIRRPTQRVLLWETVSGCKLSCDKEIARFRNDRQLR